MGLDSKIGIKCVSSKVQIGIKLISGGYCLVLF